MLEYAKTGAVLFAVRLDKMAEFYRDVAGLSVQYTDQQHVVLENDTFRLTVHQIPPAYLAGVEITAPPQVLEAAAIKLSFPVPSLSAARAAASRLGGCVYGEDREWVWGSARVCDGWDVEGNVFQLWEPAG